MTKFDELGAWLRDNRPDLNKRLNGLLLQDALAVLNAETGLSLSGGELREEVAGQFLEALKAQHGQVLAKVQDAGGPLLDLGSDAPLAGGTCDLGGACEACQ